MRLMAEMETAYLALAETVQAKITAMRRADRDGMRRQAEREQELVAQLSGREGLRRQLMDAIGKELGMSSTAARLMTATQLAARLPERSRAALQERVCGLREAAARVAKVTAAELRDHFNTTRKYAVGLLEHLNAIGVMRRVGDAHVLAR